MRYLVAVRFIILGIICVTFLGAPVVSTVAQTTTRTQQLEALSATLIVIGDSIRTSTTLTEQQRLNLYTQLVGVSNAIVALRRNEVGPAPTNTGVTQSQDLSRVVLKYDYNRPTEVRAEVQFATSTSRTFTWQYPQLLDSRTFGSRMSALRQFGSYDIAREFGISQSDARRLIYLSSRNPDRDLGISKNSAEANKLLADFGKYSVIEKVEILPGMNKARVQLTSDQDEFLVIEIHRNQIDNDRDIQTRDGDKYNYRHAFSLTDVNINRRNMGPDETDIDVISEIVERNIEKDRVKEILVSLFGKHPLTREIDDYDNKLFKFMLENGAYVSIGDNARPTPSDKTCYDPADVLVVNELVTSLIAEMKLQHYAVDELLNITAPIQVEEYTNRITCYGVRKFF
ncbi:MAG: hypothetical protein ACK42D_04200 [Candidatus Paceibacteria bacterium]